MKMSKNDLINIIKMYNEHHEKPSTDFVHTLVMYWCIENDLVGVYESILKIVEYITK